MMKRFIRKITYANVMASVALLLALTGTSFAATLINGKRVKDNSLTSADFKRGTLSAADLSSAARLSFVGPIGDKGSIGSTGTTGTRGATGAIGAPGLAARLTSAWASRDTGQLINNPNFEAAPNQTDVDWDSSTYGGNVVLGVLPNLRTLPASYTGLHFGGAYSPALQLQGMNSAGTAETVSASGGVIMPWSGKLSATASLTLMHRRDGETHTAATGGILRHGRVQCQLRYGIGTNTATFLPMGVADVIAPIDQTSVYASSARNHELVNVTMNASVDTSATLVPAGTYNVAALCRNADMAPSNEANTVTVSATGGTFTLSFLGQTTGPIAYNASATNVQTALENLSTVELGDLTVAAGPGDANATSAYRVTWKASLGNVSNLTVNGAGLVRVPLLDLSDQDANTQTLGVAANGGNFSLTVEGTTIPNLAYNIPAASLEAALETQLGLTDADLTVTGGPGSDSGGTYTLVWTAGVPATTSANDVSFTRVAPTVVAAYPRHGYNGANTTEWSLVSGNLTAVGSGG